MTNKEAIKYLQQLYPNGGHCWLDEQRIEAIGMAVKALQEEPVSEDLEKIVEEIAEPTILNAYGVKEIANRLRRTMIDSVTEDLGDYINELSKQFPEVSFAKLSRIAVRVVKWKEQQMMAKAVDAVVKIDAGGYPYVDRTIELYDYDKDIPLAKRGDKVKVLVIKEE